MKLKFTTFLALLLLCGSIIAMSAANVSAQRPATGKKTATTKTTTATTKTTADEQAAPATGTAANEETLKTELDAIVLLAPAERAERLQAFLKKRPSQTLRLRAQEQLTSARAALGDEKLRTGDRRAGVELFRLAVTEAPPEMSDKLFVEVLSQLPANLYLLHESDAAFDLARRLEQKVSDNAPRLLSIVTFYLGVEQPDDAARVAEAAIKLKPDVAIAHQALATARRMALRLDDAATEYARAHELDPSSKSARLSLADLRRATGKPDDALALYREQLALDAKDAAARAGVVLSLFDAGKREEAEKELQSALEESPDNLPLLVGAAYWYAAHDGAGSGGGAGSSSSNARGVELAERAVALEPRFHWVWARMTLARALLAQKRPLDAERALRPALALGQFPTLNYELASVLAAAGLYDEAATELSRSFNLRGDGELEAQLAGRVRAHAKTFTELLAPERRASLFQFTAADTDENARQLRALLAFTFATSVKAEVEGTIVFDEKGALAAANDFASGADEMRAFRQLYAANRMSQIGINWGAVVELTESAKSGVESALDAPSASVAAFADELRDMRAQAIAQGATTTAPNVSRDLLSKVMRGRIEDLGGYALYNQGNVAEAVVRLRRAVSVMPENSPWARTALWHLGTALDASGNQKDALATYIKGYKIAPDPARRLVVEALYRKMNNSLDGLDKLLNETPAPVATNVSTEPATVASPPPTNLSSPASASKTTNPTTTNTPANVEASAAPTQTPAPAIVPAATPSETVPAPTPEATPAAAATTTPTPDASPTPQAAAMPETKQPPGQQKGIGDSCTASVSESAVELGKNGGSATLMVSLENYGAATKPRIEAATLNWSDIVVLAEPHAAADGNTYKFTITSTSQKAGTFSVSFTTPCGKRAVTVNVK